MKKESSGSCHCILSYMFLQVFQLMYHGLAVSRLEHGIACHQHISSGLYEPSPSVEINAAVNLYQCLRPCTLDQPAQLVYLVYGVFYELLSAKSWIHCHE